MQNINRTYRLISLTLALMIFTSSVGLTIDLHYCGGELKSTSFIGNAKSCHDIAIAKSNKSCRHHQKTIKTEDKISSNPKDCCENKTQRYQLDDDRNIVISDINISTISTDFIHAFIFVFALNINSYENKTESFNDYHPPIISRDFSVLFQNFLL